MGMIRDDRHGPGRRLRSAILALLPALLCAGTPLHAQAGGTGEPGEGSSAAAQLGAAQLGAAQLGAAQPEEGGIAQVGAAQPEEGGIAQVGALTEDASLDMAAEAAPSAGPDSASAVEAEPAQSIEPVVVASQEPETPQRPVRVSVPPTSDGLSLDLAWDRVNNPKGYALLRAEAEAGPYEVVADDLGNDTTEHSDQLTTDVAARRPPDRVWYRLAPKGDTALQAQRAVEAATLLSVTDPSAGGAALTQAQAAYVGVLLQHAGPAALGVPEVSWFDVSKLALLVLIVAMGALILYYTRAARQGKEIFIRRIPGVDAIEEAVGRATEMGKPVLYIPGIGEFQEIQTIASLLILGRVAEVVATYDSDIIVPCTYPIVREVADESVRAGYFSAGRPDAYLPQNVRFISSEQFAFTASVNGIILREQPAANIYLGQFFAESLILAETGFVNKSIQIAGTAETSQIPFFVTACDYTLIGEELYAVSAYLTREPRLTSSLRASDWIRLGLIALLVLGTLEAALFGSEIIKSALLLEWP